MFIFNNLTFVHLGIYYKSLLVVFLKRYGTYIQRNTKSHKKQWDSGIWDNMVDLENMMLSQISQTEKVKSHMISLIVGYETKSNK